MSVFTFDARRPFNEAHRFGRSNRRRRVRRPHASRPIWDTLEDRRLLTAPPDFAQAFSGTNHGQFGDGNAFTSSGSYFLGGGFDTGTQTLDATISPLGLTTGVRANFAVAGKVGLNLGYFVN